MLHLTTVLRTFTASHAHVVIALLSQPPLSSALKKCRTKVNVIFLCGYNDDLHAQVLHPPAPAPPLPLPLTLTLTLTLTLFAAVPESHQRFFHRIRLVTLFHTPFILPCLCLAISHHHLACNSCSHRYHTLLSAKKLGYNASSFAFTNNVPVFMQLADVVVCKPGETTPHHKQQPDTAAQHAASCPLPPAAPHAPDI